MHDFPLAVLVGTIASYWIGVGVMIARVRRQTHRVVGLIPEQRLERFMWLVWAPLVAAWIIVPAATLVGSASTLALPAFATREPVYAALRWVAAVVAVISLFATIQCWLRMGSAWRMDVGIEHTSDLITDGPFARVRHPIYAFSILLMLCSVAIVPTAPMALIAAVHIILMNIKARNEERHLAGVHGDAYVQYLRRTGRFLPRYAAPANAPSAR